MVKQTILYLHANYLCLEQDFDSTEKFSVQKDRVSHMLPETFQDRIIRVYTKKKELVCWKDYVLVLDDTEAPINDLKLKWVVFLSSQFCTVMLALWTLYTWKSAIKCAVYVMSLDLLCTWNGV